MSRTVSRRLCMTGGAALISGLYLPEVLADQAKPPRHRNADAALEHARTSQSINRAKARRYRFETPGRSVQSGGAIIGINKPLADVLKVVMDFRKYKRILPRLEQSRIVSKKPGQHTDVYVRAPVLGGMAHVWGVVRFADPVRWRTAGKKVVGHLHKGNLEVWESVWKMYRCGPERTVLRLEVYGELSIPVPASVVTPELEWAADRGVTAVRDIAECGHSTVADD